MKEDGDCLLWTAGVNGNKHPMWRVNGKSQAVRRVLWEEAKGPIPDGRVLRLTCGMYRCLNLDHCKPVSRKTVATECGRLGLMSGAVRSARIAASKRAHPKAKLTADIVSAIRASDETQSVLGQRYGICQKTVCNIKRGLLWRDYSSPFVRGLT
jgi:hypothetical protein